MLNNALMIYSLKVQQSLIKIYMNLNDSMMAALQKAETVISAAQDKPETQSSPFINNALEHLKRATTELNSAMTRVG